MPEEPYGRCMRPAGQLADIGNMKRLSPEKEQTLAQQVLVFDRILSDKRALARLNVEEANRILRQIRAFQQAANALTPHVEQSRTCRLWTILAAGCRLCADLSEHLMLRGVDMLQDKDHSIDFLHQQLRHKIRDRALANRLVNEAQQIRHHNNAVSETSGLGMIL